MKKNNAVANYSAFLKRKMISSRIMGILVCLLALASIVAYYFKFVNEWLCMIVLSYCIATIFISNSFLQDIKVGNPWQRINSIFAIFFFLVVIFLIVYGFVTGNLATKF